jgi:hypothetical protein
MEDPAMTSYPILFSVRDPVIGNGFVAGVAVKGRALMRKESEGYWVDGVFPGALCAGGVSRDEALLKFRESYRSVLYDLARGADSFAAFRAEVERFFWEETPGEADAWLRAASELRKDAADARDWLRIRTAYPDPEIHVVLLDQQHLEPRENPAQDVELAAA